MLTLLFLATVLDLLVLAVFGTYCYFVHPRRNLYARNLGLDHRKYWVTLSFVYNSLIEIGEVLILVLCLPFKWTHARSLITLITAPNNDYKLHFLSEVGYVVKLSVIKLPALFCQLFLLISIYKHKRVKMLLNKS